MSQPPTQGTERKPLASTEVSAFCEAVMPGAEIQFERQGQPAPFRAEVLEHLLVPGGHGVEIWLLDQNSCDRIRPDDMLLTLAEVTPNE